MPNPEYILEMNGITRQRAAEVAAKFFETNNYRFTGTGYSTWTAYDQAGRPWTFMSDSSIAGPFDERCELVTPVLHYDDMETLQELVRQLRHAGAKSDYTRGCGVHVHVDAAGQTPQSIRNLVNMMAAHEDLLKDAINIAPNRLGYCKPVDPRFLQAVNAKKPQTMEDLADVWYTSQNANWGRNEHYNDSRYHMLNLHATFTKGTIEFRLFQFDKPANGHRSGLHAGALKAYIQLCLAMCNRAKEVRSASARPMQMDNPKFAMRTWLVQKLGFKGDEFKTAREILTKRLAGNAAWRRAV